MIPVVCPRCGSGDLRLHGTIYRVDLRPRFWLFGEMEPHRRVVGHDYSCRACFFSFTTVRGRTIDAPAQTMHEAVGVNRMKELEPEKKEVRRMELDADVNQDPRDKPRKRA